ncbi:hypothetical protein K505DRAFT_342376 [Melanomma pulvis-pyrius CBS 109.77]|uniref:BTB domain-containing protein n=1 Tax=Melanomma pulvis-pyrius CBS 109.77 TaxID=1314802 RepID=A0A6A6WW14_9PLEO|nr:hypothetical protein K505DRAFT_342376 [Melanomma pulvis-pyrius CBS 109.77]
MSKRRLEKLPLSVAVLEGTVIVEVGPEHKKYHVHKDLLTYHSEYFNKALNGPWKENEERLVTLDDIEPRTYSNTEAGQCGDYLQRLKAWKFGDRFLAQDFRRAVNNDTVDVYLSNPPFYKAIIYAFSEMPERSKILDFLVDTHCIHCDGDERDSEEEQKLGMQYPRDRSCTPKEAASKFLSSIISFKVTTCL